MAGPNWNPRPITDGTEFNNKAYLCGYTDGYYGEKFGAHDKGRYGAFSAYRTGFNHGRADAQACIYCGHDCDWACCSPPTSTIEYYANGKWHPAQVSA